METMLYLLQQKQVSVGLGNAFADGRIPCRRNVWHVCNAGLAYAADEGASTSDYARAFLLRVKHNSPLSAINECLFQPIQT